LTSELERIKILEGKISKIVDYINELSVENEKLKRELEELKREINLEIIKSLKKPGKL